MLRSLLQGQRLDVPKKAKPSVTKNVSVVVVVVSILYLDRILVCYLSLHNFFLLL